MDYTRHWPGGPRGAWVTATDLPEALNHLRVNLGRNTRGHSRHTPQVAALPWSFDLESTYPSSIYHYDYVLASDVVYHHDFLDELLATMKHFCKPRTTIIWANKVRFESDLAFTENFKKVFHTNLLSDDGVIKIFMATCREEEKGCDVGLEIKDMMKEQKEEVKNEEKKEKLVEEKHEDDLHYVGRGKENDNDEPEESLTLEPERGENKEQNEPACDKKEETKGTVVITDDDCKEDEIDKGEVDNDSSCSNTASDKNITGPALVKQTALPSWAHTIFSGIGKEIYHYVGQDIVIYECIDFYGAVMWPAALALCCYLDNNREKVNLQGKEVLELGAGTGLVTIVASLLGASVTATDLPEVLSNLRANVMRNTRESCKDIPKVKALSWSFDMESTYPSSVYHYDYVLAADVVYHHDFLDELLATMKHFCKPGTTVIWANKVRLESDLAFTENFKNAFYTSLLFEDGDMKIFQATCRE
ncbi:uncharacterized protein [Channa argus]|uniref:uncharacterized protein isoform X2 n=1 Tax=Channa argus TaxID=215402 RepID=UPI003520A8C0